MARFVIRWDRDQETWRVYDDDGMEAAEFGSLLEAETYVVERSERSER